MLHTNFRHIGRLIYSGLLTSKHDRQIQQGDTVRSSGGSRIRDDLRANHREQPRPRDSTASFSGYGTRGFEQINFCEGSNSQGSNERREDRLSKEYLIDKNLYVCAGIAKDVLEISRGLNRGDYDQAMANCKAAAQSLRELSKSIEKDK